MPVWRWSEELLYHAGFKVIQRENYFIVSDGRSEPIADDVIDFYYTTASLSAHERQTLANAIQSLVEQSGTDLRILHTLVLTETLDG